jgi:hypothetical protein
MLASLVDGTMWGWDLMAIDTVLTEKWKQHCRSSVVLFSQAPVCWLWCNLKRKGTRVDCNEVCMEQDIVDHCVGLRLEVDWVVAEKMHF